MKKKRVFLVLLPLLSFSLSSCGVIEYFKENTPLGSDENKEEQKGFRLSTYKKEYVIGETYTFYYFNYQDNEKIIYDNVSYFVKGAKYSVENPTVLFIDESGLTKALKEGRTYVYLKSEWFSFKCEVTVEKKRLSELEVNNYRSTYYSGKAFNFTCEANAVYQNGFKEVVTPEIDTSEVDTSTPGTYNVKISYTLNGTTKEVTKQIEILDGAGYVIEKTPLAYTLSDLEHNSGSPMLPKSGSPKMLIIPVAFTESNDFITNYDNVKQDIKTVFFGTSSQVGYESVKTYYEKESFNKVSLTGNVSDWFSCNKSFKDINDTSATERIKNDAIDWYFENNPTDDRKSYDLDNDGFLDGVVLIYGAPDYVTGKLKDEEKNDRRTLWASVVSATGYSGNKDKPIACGYMWASYDFMYPTTERAFSRSGKGYSYAAACGTKMNHMQYDPFTYIHETGHLFGLEDYYSYTEIEKFYAGDANMQSANLLTHDPYSLMLFGWADPYIPEYDGTITIGGLVDTHDIIMLKPDTATPNSPFDEYILIDLYTPSGLNKYHAVEHPSIHGPGGLLDDLAYPGIRIWHVDARLANRNQGYNEGTLTTNPKSSGATLIADNSFGKTKTKNASDDPYRNYLELTLIRNDSSKKLTDLSYVRKGDLFETGDTFSQNEFSKQFPNGTTLDAGSTLGWSIKVDAIMKVGNEYVADIKVTRS